MAESLILQGSSTKPSQDVTPERARLSAENTVNVLPDDYYLHNFRFLLRFVNTRYEDLLTWHEAAFVKSFESVAESAQRLFVRLVLRKGPFFRRDKLGYPEISDLDQAAIALEEAGLLAIYQPGFTGSTRESAESIEAFLMLLTKPELLSLLKSCLEFETPPAQLSKADLLELGVEHLTIDDFSNEVQFSVFQPLGIEYLELLKLLFFGNMYQDFTEFVLNDLGVTPFEQYTIDNETRFFRNRDIIDDTVQLYHLNELSYVAIENNDLDALLQIAEIAILVHEPSLQRRRDKIVNRIARQLERLEEHHNAIRLFGLSKATPARERRARMYDSVYENVDQAFLMCEEIVAKPEDEAEYEFAAKFGRRILKKNKLPVPTSFPELKAVVPSVRNLELEFDPQQRVEEATRRWFVSKGHDAAYVENALFTGIFGLVFWDIIFMPVKGVFFNPFQRGPVDLFTSEFRLQREALIKARLDDIKDGAFLCSTVLKTFEDKRFTANFLVNWHLLNLQLLERALDRIPPKDFCSVFERLLVDLRSNRSGLPDLIVFPATGGYQLTEVKGPGDKLQANQSRWIRHFEEAEIPIEVVNVQWS